MATLGPVDEKSLNLVVPISNRPTITVPALVSSAVIARCSVTRIAPAGIAGEAINLALPNPADHAGAVTVNLSGVPGGWTLSEGTVNGDGTWTVQTNDLGSLSVIAPSDYAGATALHVTETWTNANASLKGYTSVNWSGLTSFPVMLI